MFKSVLFFLGGGGESDKKLISYKIKCILPCPFKNDTDDTIVLMCMNAHKSINYLGVHEYDHGFLLLSFLQILL